MKGETCILVPPAPSRLLLPILQLLGRQPVASRLVHWALTDGGPKPELCLGHGLASKLSQLACPCHQNPTHAAESHLGDEKPQQQKTLNCVHLHSNPPVVNNMCCVPPQHQHTTVPCRVSPQGPQTTHNSSLRFEVHIEGPLGDHNSLREWCNSGGSEPRPPTLLKVSATMFISLHHVNAHQLMPHWSQEQRQLLGNFVDLW